MGAASLTALGRVGAPGARSTRLNQNHDHGRRKIELSLGDGYWHPWAFVDLRPGDIFRYTNKDWVGLRATTMPTDIPRYPREIGVVALPLRWTWRRLMSTIKKGLTEQAREMWTHLRPWGKRDFWKRQRGADKKALRRRDDD